LEERLSLSPAVLHNSNTLLSAIHRQLLKRLFRYDPILQGAIVLLRALAPHDALMAHTRQVGTASAAESLLDIWATDRGFLHIRLPLEALVFTPFVSTEEAETRPHEGTLSPTGARLYGRIVFLGTRHVALRVFGIFHAAIGKEDMHGRYRREKDRWTRSECADTWDGEAFQQTDLQLGQVLCFQVNDLQHAANGLFLIRGSLRETHLVERTEMTPFSERGDDSTSNSLEYSLPDTVILEDTRLQKDVQHFLRVARQASATGDRLLTPALNELVDLEALHLVSTGKTAPDMSAALVDFEAYGMAADALDRDKDWNAAAGLVYSDEDEDIDASATHTEAVDDALFSPGLEFADPLAELVAASSERHSTEPNIGPHMATAL
jgi:hypothetical protein